MENLSAEFFKKTQKITAEACGISERSIQNTKTMIHQHLQEAYSRHRGNRINGRRS